MKKNNIPMRRCVGCMESKPQQELIRIAYFDGALTIDSTGRAKGRGVYLCNNADCQNKARKKKALQRNFSGEITEAQVEAVFQELSNE